MPRVCTVCDSPNRDAIDSELVAGRSMRQIAIRHAVGEYAVSRHRDNHLSPALAAVVAGEERERAGSLVEEVRSLIGRTQAVLNAAERSGKGQLSLSAIREVRELLRLLGAVTGELDDKPTVTVNLMAAPEWIAVRSAILTALGPYPEARAAVGASLATLSGRNGAEYSGVPRIGKDLRSVGPSLDREGQP